jgi:hypothetical protein
MVNGMKAGAGEERPLARELGTRLRGDARVGKAGSALYATDASDYRRLPIGVGGMIGNDSCGAHSVMSAFYGPGPRTSGNVVSLQILTYDGLRLEVGATSDPEFDRLSRTPGRAGRIYRDLPHIARVLHRALREGDASDA